MASGDRERQYGELPDDIFAFIADLLRRDLQACEQLKSFIRGLVVRKYSGNPGPGLTTDELVQDVLIAVLNPKTLLDFRGVPSRDVSAMTRPRAVVTPRACFISLLNSIIQRKVGAWTRKVLGPTPPETEDPSAPQLKSAESSRRPPQTMPTDSLLFQNQVEPHPAPSERIITSECLFLVRSRFDQLQLRGQSWVMRVDWLTRSVWNDQTYKEIAAEDGVAWESVRDGIHKVRAIVRSDHRRYERGESIQSILESRLTDEKDAREQHEDVDDEPESERRDA